METVYRIQNRKGMGPYASINLLWSDDILRAMFQLHGDDDYHKGPLIDCGRLPSRSNERCAFESRESLKLWFTDEELKALKRHRFCIYAITANVTARGRHQVLFDIESVTSTTKIN